MPPRHLVLAFAASALIACAGAHGGAQPAQPRAPSDRPLSQPARQQAPSGVPELDQRRLAAFVRGRLGPIKACYENGLKQDPTLGGRVMIRFTINQDGSVADAMLTSEPTAIAPVGKCMVQVVESWRTPFRPGEPVTIEYPFVFAPVE